VLTFCNYARARHVLLGAPGYFESKHGLCAIGAAYKEAAATGDTKLAAGSATAMAQDRRAASALVEYQLSPDAAAALHAWERKRSPLLRTRDALLAEFCLGLTPEGAQRLSDYARGLRLHHAALLLHVGSRHAQRAMPYDTPYPFMAND
jgi:hypothetical protein